jgi:hypothetical protein
VSVFASFEIFECNGAFDILLSKPWLHSVRALHNYETDEIRIQSSERETMLYNEPWTVRDIPRRTSEQATMGPADMGGQSEVDAVHTQVEHAANTAYVDDVGGAVQATVMEVPTEDEHTMSTAHGGNAECAVVVHDGVEHTADTAHTGNAERAVVVVHSEAEGAADTVHARYAEGAVKAVHAEAEGTAGTVHADDAEGAEAEGTADTAHAGNAERAVEAVHVEAEGAAKTAHAENAERAVEEVHGERECVAQAWGPEKQWLEEEIVRIDWRQTKEKARKATQLQRRAEQPFPFPGLGYSPPHSAEHSPRRPHPFPTPKATIRQP